MSKRLSTIRDWLESTLNGKHFTLEPASRDASFRRYWRVHTGQGSFIVMDAPPEREGCRPYAQVAKLLLSIGVNVPEVLAADFDQGFLLLSDLGSKRYLDVLHESTVERLYGDAIGALVTIQACAPVDQLPDYDETLLRSEMLLFLDWFLKTHVGLNTTQAQRGLFMECCDFLCRSAAEQPRVFVHRDYHSRNLMFNPRHNPGILDFQDALCGPLTYDLVSLLRDVYILWPRDRVETWLIGYHEQALQHGILQDDDPLRLLRWFDLMGVQRHLKVAGIFARLYHRDGKPGYLKDIPRTLDYLFSVCAQYPALRPLHTMLEEFRLSERLQVKNAEVHEQGAA